MDSDAGADRRRRRRSLGMAVVALVSLATAAGLVLIDPPQNPALFGWYWLLVLMLVLWLCGLAVADVLHTIQVQRTWMRARTRAALEEYLQCCAATEEKAEHLQD